MRVRERGFEGWASGDKAVDRLTTFVIEREKTKRLLIGAVVLLFVVAVLTMVFAPDGRETIGYAMGAVLIVLALGAIGASGFLLTAPGVEVNTQGIDNERPRRRQGHPAGVPTDAH